MKKRIVLGMAVLLLAGGLTPSISSVVVADEMDTSNEAQEKEVTINNFDAESIETDSTFSNYQPETIYKDDEGNVFTNDEVIVQKGDTDPRIQAESIGASPISIGIRWSYTTKSDGAKLRNTFRKVAVSDGALGTISGILAGAGIATGGISSVLAAIAAAAGAGISKRFSEGADLINQHPKSGKIDMYADHCTYKK